MFINEKVVKINDENMVIDKFVIAQAIYAMSEGDQPDGCSNILAKCDTCPYKRICERIDTIAKQTFDDYNKIVQTFDFQEEVKE